MVDDQDGVCAICGEPPGGRWKKLHVDHDHETGRVRALLCVSCNRALGWFRDNPEILRKAIVYLEEHSCHNQADALHIASYAATNMNGLS